MIFFAGAFIGGGLVLLGLMLENGLLEVARSLMTLAKKESR